MGVVRASGVCRSVVAFCVLAVGAGYAAATPKKVERSGFPLVADGQRYAASRPDAGSVLVRDDIGGRRRWVPAPSDCRPVDAHRGIFLLTCSKAQYLIAPGSSTLRSIPGDHDPDSEGFAMVGTRWLFGTSTDHAKVFYVNWHTGERRDFGETAGDAPPRDLDSTDLHKLPADVIFRSKRVTIRWSGPKLVAERRGHQRMTLDSCTFGCQSITVGGGLLTWAHGKVARGYALKTGRRSRWKFKKVIADRRALFDGVQHTARYVYFNVPRSSNAAGRFDVRRTSWRP